jgi:hypothetical protein
VVALRLLMLDVFSHPTKWDVLYSRLNANFYGAQKSILLHHTSECGKELARSAPTTTIAASLLGSKTLRVCEPSEALMNFAAGETGHTAWHRDDAYMAVKTVEAAVSENDAVNEHSTPAPGVVRLWIPLMDMGPERMRFLALNNSVEAQAARSARGALLVFEHDFALADPLGCALSYWLTR